MFTANCDEWAKEMFSQANLGDARRSKRLVSLASSLSKKIGQSLVQTSPTPASLTAAYRFIRNKDVKTQDIAEAGFSAVAEAAKNYDCLLAIEDTTTLSFTHSKIRDQMGYTTSSLNSRGMLAHSALLYAPNEQHVVGLIEQERWIRELEYYGKKKQRASRVYEEKESFKWKKASAAITKRLGSQMENVISVCDREADIFEYLDYKTRNNQRFIVRSSHSRSLEEQELLLHQLKDNLHAAGTRVVNVMQRGHSPN